jgi:Superinfection immunity protein
MVESEVRRQTKAKLKGLLAVAALLSLSIGAISIKTALAPDWHVSLPDLSWVGGLVVLLGMLGVYFLPWTMSTHNRLAMFTANLFFGWTLIGWLILFAIAMRRPAVVVIRR